MCDKMISDANRTEIVNLIWDKLHAQKMFSKYDIYVAAKEECGIKDFPNYFKVKKEITRLINAVIDEGWDEDIEYFRNFITRDGKTFAVFYPSHADVEQYPEWNDEDHTEDCGDDCCCKEGEDCCCGGDCHCNEGDEGMLETLDLNTDYQGRIYIPKEVLEKIEVDGEYVAIGNYGAEVAIAVSEDSLADCPNEVVWLKRVRGNSGLLVSMKNRFNDDDNPSQVSIDVDPEYKMLHIFLAD